MKTYSSKIAFQRGSNDNRRSEAGFSLTEILVVIVIIGVLVLLAMPNLLGVVNRAKNTEASLQLKHLHALQQAYFYQYDRYAKNLAEIGFEQKKLVTDGGQARFRIEIVKADQHEFIGRAVMLVDGDKDGNISTWEVDQGGNLRQVISD